MEYIRPSVEDPHFVMTMSIRHNHKAKKDVFEQDCPKCMLIMEEKAEGRMPRARL